MRHWIGRLAVAIGCLASAPVAADSLFWQVSDRQGAVCGHLLGTVHLCDRACYPLPPAVLQAFEAADTLVLELDPGDERMGAKLLQAGRLPDGRRLDALLPVQDAARLAQAAAVIGADAQALQHMRPWLAASVLAVSAAAEAGFDAAFGIDLWLAQRARARGLALLELETIERQIDALSAGTPASQLESLRQIVDLIVAGHAGSYFGRIREAWQKGDAERLLAMLSEGSDPAVLQPLVEALVVERNVEMAQRIERLMCHGAPVFVAIGGAHFGGERGVVAELRRRGLVVEPLR